MDLLDLIATVHLEISGIDEAIEKVDRLLASLQELREMSKPNQ